VPVPIRSGNSVVEAKSPTIIYQGDTAHYYGAWSQTFGYRASGYAELYKRQLWVSVVVNKRAGMVARLPLPVYQRDPQGRQRVPDHPYAKLLAKPNDRHDPVTFWTWVSSTWDVFGESFVGKVRDRGGRPEYLVPLHPTRMRDTDDGNWEYTSNDGTILTVRPHDVMHFSNYNPDSMTRGMSRLEPLRDTLENEANARRATSSFWNNGARPGFALTHPGNLSTPAGERLRAQWDGMHAGAGNTGKTVILEEGMTAQPLTIDNDKAQYIETRKLNREEVVAAYDMPPPAVHILDHATFSNITEQFRSVYRDTMAPVLGYFEAVLEHQLRGSFRPGSSEPDFGDDVYAEFLLDEVLRGSFEARQDAYDKAKYMTLAEKRERENLPFIEGTDVILVNTADQPLDMLGAVTAARINGPAGQATAAAALPADTVRSLMGRLSWQKSLDQIDAAALTAGLNGHTPLVLDALTHAKAAGGDVDTFRTRLRALTAQEPS
jgi:HK97 family phage portal protein